MNSYGKKATFTNINEQSCLIFVITLHSAFHTHFPLISWHVYNRHDILKGVNSRGKRGRRKERDMDGGEGRGRERRREEEREGEVEGQ